MIEGVQIGGGTAVIGLCLAAFAYLAKSWMALNQEIHRKRAVEIEKFADLMFAFMDAHRANQIAKLGPANEKIRAAIPRLHIWTSPRVGMRVTEYIRASNEIVRLILAKEDIDEETEARFVVANTQLMDALKRDALGMSRQGISVRVIEWYLMRKARKQMA